MAKGMTYAQFFPSNWRSGTMHQLNLEEEGLYIRSCAYMWDTGEPIPGDDAFASKLLNVQIHKYRKVMGALIEKGKMTRGQGVIFNERVMGDIDAYNQSYSAVSDRVKRGHKTRKLQSDQIKELHETIAALKERIDADNPPPNPPSIPPQYTPPVSLGVTALVTPPVNSKKINKNKEPDLLDQSTITDNTEYRIQKKESTPLPPEGEGARVFKPRDVARVAFREWQEFAKVYGHPVPRDKTFDDKCARKILERVSEYAPDNPSPDDILAVWREALARVAKSKMLRGMTDIKFLAHLEFLCQKSSFRKLMDGVYGNGATVIDNRWSMQPVERLAPDSTQRIIEANEAIAAAEGWYTPNAEIVRE